MWPLVFEFSWSNKQNCKKTQWWLGNKKKEKKKKHELFPHWTLWVLLLISAEVGSYLREKSCHFGHETGQKSSHKSEQLLL